MKQRRCPHCDCKLIFYGHRIDRRSMKWVHTGSLTVCQRVRTLAAAAKAGYALSTWAASIAWSIHERNTREWLEGLRERIDTVQRLAERKV